jgi:hypothetical protein
VKGAAITVCLMAVAGLAWHEAAHLAAWAGFEDIDILWQVAAVFAALALGEAVVSRWINPPHPTT